MTWADFIDSRTLGLLVFLVLALAFIYREVQVFRLWRCRRRVRAESRRKPAPVVQLTEFRDLTARKNAAIVRGVDLDEIRLIAYVEPPITNSSIH